MTRALNTASSRKALSPGWVRFAEGVVNRAGVQDEAQRSLLIQAFAAVPRDAFMPPALRLRATEDHAFPIGYGQTISKPSTVARMLAVAGIYPGARVLEIGCGSGYCSAVISAMGAEVFAMDLMQMDQVRKLTDQYLKDLRQLAKQGKERTHIVQALSAVFTLTHNFKSELSAEHSTQISTQLSTKKK